MELEKRTMCVHTQQMQTTARLVPYQSIPLAMSSSLAAASTSVAPGAPQPSPSTATNSSTASAASTASQCQSHCSDSATPISNSRGNLPSNRNLFSTHLFLRVQNRKKNAFESRQSRYRSIGLDKEIGERRSGMSFGRRATF